MRTDGQEAHDSTLLIIREILEYKTTIRYHNTPIIRAKIFKNSDQSKQKGIEFNKSNLPSYISNYNINRNELKKLEAKCN